MAEENEQDARLKRLYPDEGEVISIKKKRKTNSKKKKPLGVKDFFSTVKNSQGFGMHLCRYEQSMGDHVYVPRNYGQLSKGKLWRNLDFCPSCKLQPCINVEHFDEIQKESFEEYYAQDQAENAGKKPKKPLAMLKKMEKFTLKFMTKYFGREYVKRVGTPGCILNETHEYHRSWYEDDRS